MILPDLVKALYRVFLDFKAKYEIKDGDVYRVSGQTPYTMPYLILNTGRENSLIIDYVLRRQK